MDPVKIVCARRNAEIYEVSSKIQFICADFFAVAPTLKADAIFLSPPWGGPKYSEAECFDLNSMMQPEGWKIFEAAKKISPNQIWFVPRNSSVQQLAAFAGSGSGPDSGSDSGSGSDPGARVEIEQNFLNKKCKTITAYYGNLCGFD